MPTERWINAFLEKKAMLDDVARLSIEESEESYEKEFTKLREISLSYKTDNVYPSVEGEKACNISKNRYKDIVPYDHARVKLKTVRDGSSSDYINASFIKGAIAGQQYIAAQGPMPKTVSDFWQMIWENGVRVVFMACREFEGEPPKLKCQRYWPALTTEEMTFGNIKVTLEKEEPTSYTEHLIRHMIARVGDEKRRIVQLHYQDWPDKGVPRCIPGILDLIDILREVQPLSASEAPPVLVHCSAGCGRTGTILVIDFVNSLLTQRKLNSKFDLFNVIAEMRKQRMAIVQSLEQYIFVHEAIAELFVRQLNSIKQHSSNNVEIQAKSQPDSPESSYSFVRDVAYEITAPAKPNSKPQVMRKPSNSSDLVNKSLGSPTNVSSASDTYSFVQPVSSAPEPVYAEPYSGAAAAAAAATSPEPPVSNVSKSKPKPPPPMSGFTYGIVSKPTTVDPKPDKTASEEKKNEYAYIDPYQSDKWSLQAIAQGKKPENSTYAFADEPGYESVSSRIYPYATGNGDPVGNGAIDDERGPQVPVKNYQPGEIGGAHPSATKEPFLNMILGKLQPQKSTATCGPYEVAQVIYRGRDISFPNRISKPLGKRPVKMA